MDFQKKRVYDWEDDNIKNKDTYLFSSLEEAQSFVDFVYYNEGRNYPPKVIKARENFGKSTGCRTQIVLHKKHFKASVLLHELAHSFTTGIYVENANNDDCKNFDIHGPKFMKVYVYLLNKYMKFDILWIITTAKQYKIKIENYI